MANLKALFKKLFQKRVVVVRVMDYEKTLVSKELKDEILLSLVNLTSEKPQVMQYILLRLQQHMADLERIEFPKTDNEMVIYAARVMGIISQVKECKHMLSVPTKASEMAKNNEKKLSEMLKEQERK